MTQPLLIIELAGPAGAGKTTIRNTLTRRDKSMQFGPIPQVREIRNLPFFLWNWILLLPAFLAILRKEKLGSLTFSLMVKLAILNGWSRQLQARYTTDKNVLVFDQGPVYMLAELLRNCPVNFRTTTPTWWERVCQEWANILDMVISLDTPDDVLLQRIRTRPKNHGIKQNADEWAVEFLAQSRWAQSEVLSSMTKQPGKVKVISFDTSRSPVDELVERISCLLDQEKKTM